VEHLRVVEAERALVHAPHYLAAALGCFEREGLVADLRTADDPPALLRLLQSGEADLALAGPRRALVAADRGEGPVRCVAEVAGRAAPYLLGRAPTDLAWSALAGRRVLTVGDSPTPRLCLEYLVERHGGQPGQVEIVGGLSPERAADLFLAGRADYLLVGQPAAEALLAAAQAHVAAAFGPALGPLPGAAYLATPRWLAERGDAVEAALRALARALRWLAGRAPVEAAARLGPAFPGVDPAVLGAAVRRYQAARTWGPDPVLRRPGFDALQEILLLRGAIRRTHAYDTLVETDRAERARRAGGAA
jgi:NitT/TauT family transport system substrate-binding protein